MYKDSQRDNKNKKSVIHLPQIPGFYFGGENSYLGLCASVTKFINKYKGKLSGKIIEIIVDMNIDQCKI